MNKYNFSQAKYLAAFILSGLLVSCVSHNLTPRASIVYNYGDGKWGLTAANLKIIKGELLAYHIEGEKQEIEVIGHFGNTYKTRLGKETSSLCHDEGYWYDKYVLLSNGYIYPFPEETVGLASSIHPPAVYYGTNKKVVTSQEMSAYLKRLNIHPVE